MSDFVPFAQHKHLCAEHGAEYECTEDCNGHYVRVCPECREQQREKTERRRSR